jgi:hypothetical protein
MKLIVSEPDFDLDNNKCYYYDCYLYCKENREYNYHFISRKRFKKWADCDNYMRKFNNIQWDNLSWRV